jgi:hypothetical protein
MGHQVVDLVSTQLPSSLWKKNLGLQETQSWCNIKELNMVWKNLLPFWLCNGSYFVNWKLKIDFVSYHKMSDFWFYNKIFKDYINKARLWDLITAYKKQNKNKNTFRTCNKIENTTNDVNRLYAQKSSQWYTCKRCTKWNKEKECDNEEARRH